MPVLHELGAEPQCKTKSKGRGVCCEALTKLGAAGAASGFRYTDCNGVERCARCTIVASTSKHHPGRHVFQYRGVTGCGKGCAALGNQ